jgi:hypothetical protein
MTTGEVDRVADVQIITDIGFPDRRIVVDPEDPESGCLIAARRPTCAAAEVEQPRP